MNKQEFERAAELMEQLKDARSAMDAMPEKEAVMKEAVREPWVLAFELSDDDGMLRCPVPAEYQSTFYDQMREALQARVDEKVAALADLGVEA